MSTRGRSEQATTSIGNDGDHRMRVDNRYAQMSDLKKKLDSLMRMCNIFYVVILALGYYVITSNNNKMEAFPIPVEVIVVSLFQFIGRYGTKSNSAGALVAYSSLIGVGAAAFLYFGVGRTSTIMQLTEDTSMLHIFILGTSLFGSALHIACVFISRKLIKLMEVRRPVQKKKE
eukprot:m.6049 g.6049  ORF g.6049 m.6049 type:complete len:174 (-) comp2538_c0_seq1:170-691(-)